MAIYNNLIGNLISAGAEGENMLIGIAVKNNEFKKVLVYYNTVYINNTSTASFFGSSAMYSDTESALDLRNNIFVNTSTPAGSGKTVAFRRTGLSLFNYAATSTNNLFYAGVPGPSNLIFLGGTAEDQTLDDFRSRAFPKDNLSMSAMPVWFSLTGNDYEYLRLASINQNILTGGKYIEDVKTDYSGIFRDINTPSIGAWEGGKPLSVIENQQHKISVFPNPTYDFLNIESEKERIEIALIDLSGKIIYRKTINNNNASIDFTVFPKGFLILQIANESTVFRQKILHL